MKTNSSTFFFLFRYEGNVTMIFNDLEYLLMKETLRVDYKPFVGEVLHHVFIDTTKDKIRRGKKRGDISAKN